MYGYTRLMGIRLEWWMNLFLAYAAVRSGWEWLGQGG